MKLSTNLAILILALIAFTGCRKSKTPEEAKVTFKFENTVDGQNIEKNTPLTYTNAAGNQYSVGLLKYYISYIELTDAEGNTIKLKNHDLIDAFGKEQLAPITLPNGEYTTMKFTFGVHPDSNTTGDQSGDLEPSNNMIWSWSTGYIFSKHEGKYRDASNAEQNLELHYGGKGNQVEIVLNNIGLTVEGTDKEASINFNLNNMYNNPVIDFNTDYFRHSMPAPAEQAWVQAIKSNMNDIFTFAGSKDL